MQAAILENAYLAADIEQNQLLPGNLDAGEFSSHKSSSAITACHVTGCLFLHPLVRAEVEYLRPLKSLPVRTRRLPEVPLELADEVGEACIPYAPGYLTHGIILQ